MKCKKCGANVPENSKFCMDCGEKVIEETLVQSNENQVKEETPIQNIESKVKEESPLQTTNNQIVVNNNTPKDNNSLIIVILVLAVLGVTGYFGYKTINNYLENINKKDNDTETKVDNDYVMVNEDKVDTMDKVISTIKRSEINFTEEGGSDKTSKNYSSKTKIEYENVTSEDAKTYADYLFKNGYSYTTSMKSNDVITLAKDTVNNHQIYITIDTKAKSITYQYICNSLDSKIYHFTDSTLQGNSDLGYIDVPNSFKNTENTKDKIKYSNGSKSITIERLGGNSGAMLYSQYLENKIKDENKVTTSKNYIEISDYDKKFYSFYYLDNKTNKYVYITLTETDTEMRQITIESSDKLDRLFDYTGTYNTKKLY